MVPEVARRFSAALLLVAAAAAIASSSCNCGTPACAVPATAAPDGGVHLEREHVRVEFQQQFPPNCEEQTKIDSVQADVVDEANAPVPANAAFTQRKGELFANVSIDFDARAPGWYHAAAHLEPGLATVQFPVLIARDRSDAGTLTVFSHCHLPELTARLDAVCDGAPYHSDRSIPEFFADVVAVSGNVVWALTGTKLERWEDSGGAFVKTAGNSATAEANSVLVAAADGGEVFPLGAAQVSRVAFRGGALVTLAATPLGRTLRFSYGLATADTLYAIAVPSFNNTNGKISVCPYSLANDIVTAPATCQEIQGLALGIGDGAFWTRDEASIRVWRPSSGQLRSAGTVLLPPLSTRPPLGDGHSAAPVLDVASGWLAPRFDGVRFFFDRYPTTPGASFDGVSMTAFSETTGTGATLVYAR